MEIKNKVALVTGASQGIGKAVAIALAKHGAKVIINFNSNQKMAKEVLNECNKHSKDNISIKANIAEEKEVKEMINEINKKHKKIDILVNNAGIFNEEDKPTNIEAFEETFNVNF